MRSLIPFDGLFGDTVLDDFFDAAPVSYAEYKSLPKVDIEDCKDHYEVTCDMPGFTKDEIHVTYENGVLSIAAKKETTEDGKEHNYIRKERTSTTFQRQFAVKDIEESKISASLNDGVLKIELPKKDMSLPNQGHRIEIG
ncbi:Hsp20/alpha crystallin family protein [uncultured Dialister sp.]|jgi:HSP20 family protein|uniref:Hsp20/alpha crystallin family protein n=1 Tax=uncultured Dialister sp. TaxID=278064 RepID=UPI0025DEBA84|nr:Hsp20/alpha crystallin family protein [uncultured Dialister sp.]